MSQHHFDTVHEGQSMMVMMGWDRPLQGFFMTLDNGQYGPHDEPFYSNLDDPNLKATMGYTRNFDYFLGVLKKYGISIPQAMVEGILSDSANNVGNKQVHYSQ